MDPIDFSTFVGLFEEYYLSDNPADLGRLYTSYDIIICDAVSAKKISMQCTYHCLIECVWPSVSPWNILY